MADAVPEGFVGLTAQSAPRVVNNGATDEDRKTQLLVLKEALQCVDGCLGVESVKDGQVSEVERGNAFMQLSKQCGGVKHCSSLTWEVRVPLKVLVSRMSAPASKNWVVVAPQLMRVLLVAITPEVLLSQPEPAHEESAVEAAPHRLIAPKGEGNVGDAPTDLAARALPLDLPGSPDEVHSIVVVLRHAGANSEDVGVEDDVFRVKAHCLTHATLTAHIVMSITHLAFLIKGHDDHSSSMALDGGSVLPEGLLALLHGDGVDDALALAALEARLHNEELGGVNHKGHLADLRFSGSSPLNRIFGSTACFFLGSYFSAIALMAAMCSGPVPQQPPMQLTSCSSQKGRISSAISEPFWSYPPMAFGSPAFG
ncbi:MAG: hypothetical protein FRX49_03479 [Trebouxia sp. A1-2]|nr:MAG: hypothetical protein FRX49_03479 [Trebouxia sp. A1-2]